MDVFELNDAFVAWVRRDHPLPLRGTRKKFWIHCPNCSYTGVKCDFGKDDGFSSEMALEAAYEHVQKNHPLVQTVVLEMLQSPVKPAKLTKRDKLSLR